MKMVLNKILFLIITFICFSIPISKNEVPISNNEVPKIVDTDQENITNILIPKRLHDINNFISTGHTAEQQKNWARHSSVIHNSITDDVMLKFDGRSITAKDKIFKVGYARSVLISFAEIIAMSGDFFGAHNMNQVICNYDLYESDNGSWVMNSNMSEEEEDEIRRNRAQNAFDRFYSETYASVRRLTKINKYYEVQNKVIRDKLARKPDHEEGATYSAIDLGDHEVSDAYSAIDHPELASSLLNFNTDHFGGADGSRPCAQIAYSTFHKMAVELAIEASTLQGDDKIAKLKEAYFAEGFGLHYATGQFSSGHLRTPAYELRNFCCNKVPQAAEFTLNLQQNQDNNNGLMVINAKQYLDWYEKDVLPNTFFILGNKHDFRIKKFSPDTFHWETAAIQYGIDEVYHAFKGKLSVSKAFFGSSFEQQPKREFYPGALLYVPNIELTEMYMDSCGFYRENTCPLYIIKEKKLFSRIPYSKLYACQKNGRYSTSPSFDHFSVILENDRRSWNNYEKKFHDEDTNLEVENVIEASVDLPGGCGKYFSFSNQKTCVQPSDAGKDFFNANQSIFVDSARGMLHQYLINQDLSKGLGVYDMEKECRFPPVRDLYDQVNAGNRDVAADMKSEISDEVYVDVEYDDEHDH